jgi:hypothetical protein
MKKIIRFSWVNSLVGVALCALLFSFSSRPGSHSFQVYLDSKLVIDQHVNSNMDAPKLSLDPAENYNQLVVKYNECGRTVTGRTITIKDDRNNVLKELRFEGASSGYEGTMLCPVKDILALKQKGSNTLKLYYSSKEFPVGQQLAYLVISGEPKTALNR